MSGRPSRPAETAKPLSERDLEARGRDEASPTEPVIAARHDLDVRVEPAVRASRWAGVTAFPRCKQNRRNAERLGGFPSSSPPVIPERYANGAISRHRSIRTGAASAHSGRASGCASRNSVRRFDARHLDGRRVGVRALSSTPPRLSSSDSPPGTMPSLLSRSEISGDLAKALISLRSAVRIGSGVAAGAKIRSTTRTGSPEWSRPRSEYPAPPRSAPACRPRSA